MPRKRCPNGYRKVEGKCILKVNLGQSNRQPWRSGEGKYQVKLYDKKGTHKMTQRWKTEHLAWTAGENWKMLSKGNRYRIVED